MNGVINEGYEIDCTEGELRLFAWNGNMLHSVGCLVEDGEKRWHVVGRAINE